MASSEEQVFGDPNAFATQMKKLINNRDMSDVKFVIGPSRKAVYAHRCILSARCDVFRAMFADQAQKHKDGEVPLVLSDMQPEIFLPMLDFIYTNTANLNSKNAIDVLGSSIEYGLDGLKELCVGYLMRNLSVASACEAMQAGVTYGQAALKEKAIKYIESNTKKVFESKGFHELSDDAIAEILRSHNLTIDETQVIAGVKEWASVNHIVLQKSISAVAKKVVPHLRLPLLTPDELKQVEDANGKDKMIPVEQISFAWRCHALKKGDSDNPLTTLRKGTRPRENHRNYQDTAPQGPRKDLLAANYVHRLQSSVGGKSCHVGAVKYDQAPQRPPFLPLSSTQYMLVVVSQKGKACETLIQRFKD